MVSLDLNMSTESVSSPSKDDGPRPVCDRSFLLPLLLQGVSRKVDIGNGCNASEEDKDKESDSDPNWERNTPSVPPVYCSHTCSCENSHKKLPVSNTLVIFTYPHSLLGSLPWMPSLPMAAIQLVCKSSLQPSFLSLSSWYFSLSTMPAPYPPISALPSHANFTCSMTFHQSHCSALLYQCGLVSTWQDVLLWCNSSQASLLLIPARKISSLSHFIDETIFLLSKSWFHILLNDSSIPIEILSWSSCYQLLSRLVWTWPSPRGEIILPCKKR